MNVVYQQSQTVTKCIKYTMFCHHPITVALQAVAFFYFSLLFIVIAGTCATIDLQRPNGKATLLYAMLAAIMAIYLGGLKFVQNHTAALSNVDVRKSRRL